MLHHLVTNNFLRRPGKQVILSGEGGEHLLASLLASIWQQVRIWRASSCVKSCMLFFEPVRRVLCRRYGHLISATYHPPDLVPVPVGLRLEE
jgi:hypothetical protein